MILANFVLQKPEKTDSGWLVRSMHVIWCIIFYDSHDMLYVCACICLSSHPSVIMYCMVSCCYYAQDILDRTGYSLNVTRGQRKYGGPPPDYDGPPPGPGQEVNERSLCL